MTDIYRTAGLELDLSRLQVRRAGKVVPVQPQVFDVLRYLVENRGNLLKPRS